MASPQERTWRTANGREFHVERMEVTHIWNAMIMLRRNIDLEDGSEHNCEWESSCSGCDAFKRLQEQREAYIRMFEIELLRRGLSKQPDLKVLKQANDMYEASTLAKTRTPASSDR